MQNDIRRGLKRSIAGLTSALMIMSAAPLASVANAQDTWNALPDSSDLPLPTRRPEDSGSGQADPGASSLEGEQIITTGDDASADDDEETSGVALTAVDQLAQEACEASLNRIGVTFKRISPISDGDGCNVPVPLEVSRLSDAIALKPSGTMNCSTALALANWVDDTLLPAAERSFPGRSLVAIRQSSTYVCRPRNNQPGAKLSEHATANAVDIAGFEFADGEYHEVRIRQRTGSVEEAFQKAVRFGACIHFTTVLGPLSDINHADHFHLDLAQRRGGYRLCRFPEIVREVSEDAPVPSNNENEQSQ